jgi:amino acid permease
MVTVPGFLLRVLLFRDFTPTVMGYWLAAVLIVAVGAPLGALICSHMKRHAIALLLLFLIVLEFLSTLLLVPMSRPMLWGPVLFCSALVAIRVVAWVVFGLSQLFATRSNRSRRSVDERREQHDALHTPR